MSEIDLSQLPAPNVVQPLDFEAQLQRLKALVLAQLPDLAEVLSFESEPVIKLLELIAYEHVAMQARINDAAKACMLAYAQGADLDHLAANLGTQRLAQEPDADLRRRTQLALEGFTVAGSSASYRYHALSAHSDVRDAGIDSPSPGTVRVTVLSRSNNGAASPELLDTVASALSAHDVRPLSDNLQVQAATLVPWSLQATLHPYPGPAAQPLLDAAQAALASYLQTTAGQLGHDITLSALYACLHQNGIQRVELNSPSADIAIAPTEAAHCIASSITLGSAHV